MFENMILELTFYEGRSSLIKVLHKMIVKIVQYVPTWNYSNNF